MKAKITKIFDLFVMSQNGFIFFDPGHLRLVGLVLIVTLSLPAYLSGRPHILNAASWVLNCRFVMPSAHGPIGVKIGSCALTFGAIKN